MGLKKILIIILSALVHCDALATHYYVATKGNDSNAGTSPAIPWKTIDKVNATTFFQGDIISFKGGDKFYGTIIVSQSGAPGNPIIFNSYGTGNAIITGFKSVTSWTHVGINLWKSSSAVTTLPELRMVTVNDRITAMDRTPNKGSWYHYQSGNNKSITSSDLTGSADWTGAGMVVHLQNWQYDRADITSQTGSTINFINEYAPDTSWAVVKGHGFFIQDDPRTLDRQNEWYFDKSGRRLEMFSIGTPKGVKVGTLKHLFYDSLQNYIQLHNLTFTGSEGDAVYFTRDNISCKVEQCEISYSGRCGMLLTYGNHNMIDSNFVHNTVAHGIDAGGSNLSIEYNIFEDIGLTLGLVPTTSFNGIRTAANSGTIIGNRVIRAGGDGLGDNWHGGTLIQYNFVDSADMRTNDHGGIYASGDKVHRVIDHNIILHSVGYNEDLKTGIMAEGLYIDDDSKYKLITNNTVAFCNNMNFKMHGGHYDTVRNNTFYAGVNGMGLCQDGSTGQGNNIITNNISVALSGDYSGFYRVDAGYSLSAIGTIDSNYYASEIPSKAIYSAINYSGKGESLASWQSNTGNDRHSHTAPQSYTDSDTKFVYNATFSDTIIPLHGIYHDVKGNQYNSGSITLHSFESAVLFKTVPATPTK